MNKKILIKITLALLLILTIVMGSYLIFGKKGAPKVYRVGILSGLDLFVDIVYDFKAEMTNLGYLEGKNVLYDIQRVNFEPEKEKLILKKFVSDKVDLIFGFNTEVALEAKDTVSGTGIPVVFANALTEGNNLVKSIQAPGGNVTGVRYPGTDITLKRLEILHEIAPRAKRIWLPYQHGYPVAPIELKVLRPAALAMNLTLVEFASDDLAHLRSELERRAKTGDLGFDAVLLIPESLSTTEAAFEVIAKYTRNCKIPIGGSRIVTKDYGTLFAVTINNKEVGVQAAHLADKVLKGAPAGTIPVVSPESRIMINCKVAKHLGLAIKEGLIFKASEIIR